MNDYSRNIGVVGMAYTRVTLPCLNAVPEYNFPSK